MKPSIKNRVVLVVLELISLTAILEFIGFIIAIIRQDYYEAALSLACFGITVYIIKRVFNPRIDRTPNSDV